MNAIQSLFNDQIYPQAAFLARFLQPYYIDLKKQLSFQLLNSFETLDLLVLYTIFLILLFKIILPILHAIYSFSWRSAKSRCHRYLIRTLPYYRRKIDEELKKTEKEVFTELSKYVSNQTYKLPKNGFKLSTIQDRLATWLKRDEALVNSSKISGTKYINDPDYEDHLKEFIKDFFFHNPLHFDIFCGARQMEAEILSMTGLLLGCDKDRIYGSTTSGGTESNMMAIYTYREWARETKNITNPEIIVPNTAHASFYKAAHFYNVKIITLEVKEKTGKIDLASLKKAITSNTICIVGSMPNYPHGICDPIEEMAAIALKHKVGMHVDACLGGFLIVFAKENKIEIPKFDFTVPGVTSISIDHHKYGLANKGISSVFYKTKELRHFQYFSTISWPGGIYVTATAPGSRSGAWFAMTYNGLNKYKENAKKIYEATRKFREKIEAIKALKVIGDPKICVVAFKSNQKNLNIYSVHEILSQKGWNLNALNLPPCIHITITLANEPSLNTLVQDIQGAIELVLNSPGKYKGGVMGTIYGTTKQVPDTHLADEFMKVVLDTSLKI